MRTVEGKIVLTVRLVGDAEGIHTATEEAAAIFSDRLGASVEVASSLKTTRKPRSLIERHTAKLASIQQRI